MYLLLMSSTIIETVGKGNFTWLQLLRDIGVFSIATFFIQHFMNNSANRKMERYKQELNFNARKSQLDLDADLEKYKQELDFNTRTNQLALDSNLENYKSEISLLLHKQTVLHEKRSVVIDEMYKHVVTLQSAMLQMTSFMKPVYEDAEKEEEASKWLPG